MLSAIATLDLVCCDDASLAVDYGVTDKCHLLLLGMEKFDGSRRAHLTTEIAVIEAITFVESHHRLHYTLQSILSNGRL